MSIYVKGREISVRFWPKYESIKHVSENPLYSKCHRIRLVEFALFPPDTQTDMRKKYCYVQPHCGKLKIETKYII